MEELRSRFGLTYIQAREKLDSLKKTAGSSIHELGTEISKLMRLGHPNMHAADREDLAIEKFINVMNNVELKRYLLPLRPTPCGSVSAIRTTFCKPTPRAAELPDWQQ